MTQANTSNHSSNSNGQLNSNISSNSLSLLQLIRQLTAAEIASSALYVSLDLQMVIASDLVGDTANRQSTLALPPYEIIKGRTSYHRLTPLYFWWIKSQLQVLQALHHQGKLIANVFQNWRIRYGQIKEYCRIKFGEKTVESDLASFFAGLDYPQIVEMTGTLEISDSFFWAISKSTSNIFPRPVHFDDVSQPLQYSNEQIQEIAGQITPNVYANWMGAVKIHYPEYCNAINTTASFLWIYVAWKMFIEIANLFSAVRRFEGIDYRLRDATVKSLMEYFTGVLKSTSLESFAEDTEERAGVNIREDFAA